MDDLLSEFLTETNESLQVLDTELVRLEQNPDDPGLLDNIFRVMHTIKGTCGFLGLPRLEAAAHAGENLLGLLRDGSLTVTPERVSLVLESLDRIRDILASLEATEAEPEGDDADLIARLDEVCAKAGKEDTAAEGAEDEEGPAAEVSFEEAGEESAATAEEPMEVLRETEPQAAPPEPATGGDLLPFVAPGGKGEARGEERGEERGEGGQAAAAKQTPQPAPETSAAGEEAQYPRESQVANQTIRVSVQLLENLMTTVSELVLNRNQLLQILRTEKDSAFSAPLQRLNHVVSELQEGVMKTRMQPIGNAWSKLPRLVRDLARDVNKKIDLRMKGEDTELDRQVLELIKDPLTHMVRNSADHGLESPLERMAAGKPETGVVSLNAYHEGGHIIIEIADDGRGLNVEKIRNKAIEKGLISEMEASSLSEQQALQLIFRPGFSTAEAVTAVSGRGVGMDVVRTNIEKIGGTIELSSELGKGTRFVVKIPLTLAIVSALIVECAGERFAIPQLSVVELVRVRADSDNAIEYVKNTPVLRLRDRLLPLVNLRRLMQLNGPGEPGGASEEDETRAGFIVVAQVGTYTFGIIVDRVFDTEEIVVKPVSRILRNLPLFSGNTILGDGRVVMILDPNGIASAGGEAGLGEVGEASTESKRLLGEEEEVSMLVVRAGRGGPKAVPLALVARLEEIDLEQVEDSNGQRVVQYRGQLMPLVTIEEGEQLPESGKRPILVFADRDRVMGLVVEEIVDIVQCPMKIELSGDRRGFLGSAVIAGKATDILDTGHFLTRAFRDWFGVDTGPLDGDGTGRRVLLIDDSPFFRNMLAPLLRAADYQVTVADGPEEALRLCEKGLEVDVIVSDIEMPGMNGFELAQTLRSRTRWAEIPMIALSSHATPRDLDRGRAAGFHDYVAKFDRDTLLETLQQILIEQAYGEERGAA